MRNRSELIGTIVLIVCWAATLATIKIAVGGFSPFQVAAGRCLIGALLLLPVAIASGRGPGLRANWFSYLLLTVGNVVGFTGLQTYALQSLPSGLVGVLIYLQPVLVAVFAAPLLGEPLGRAKLLGLLIAFVGIVVVSADALGGRVSVVGLLCALGSALAWTFGTLTFRHYSDRVDPRWSVALPFLVGGMLLVGVSFLQGDPPMRWVLAPTIGLIISGVFGTGIAWLLYFWLVSTGGAGRTTSRIFFVPILAVLIGAVVLHERLSVTLLIGGALVVLGVWLANRRVSVGG
ncbi:DMT family transporter [Naumannella sp. ID2617S]|nr:DMT family transporter [Naumannella sp. ID2617S]